MEFKAGDKVVIRPGYWDWYQSVTGTPTKFTWRAVVEVIAEYDPVTRAYPVRQGNECFAYVAPEYLQLVRHEETS